MAETNGLGCKARPDDLHTDKDQGAASIRSTILDAAMQCAAIEGSFPTNLAYLEDNYDLRVNHDDYVIIYEVLASNTVPSVVVMPR